MRPLPLPGFHTGPLTPAKRRCLRHARPGRSAQVLRYAHVHSVETPDVLSHMAAAAVRARPIRIIGDANQRIDFVHIDDVVAANFAALHRAPRFEIHHISADRPISLFELGQRIRAWCGESVRFEWVALRNLPDMDRIPDFGVMNDDTDYAITKLDRIVVKANVELIVDNLLDLSHTSFLHEGILGNSEMVDAEIDVREESGAVIVGRSSTNTPIPGMFAPLFPTESCRVDKWNNIRWTAPSNLLLRSGVCTPGADPESGTGYYGIHLLTPESDETTHYFFTAVRWNMLTRGDELNGQIREKLSVTRRFAFEDQDAPVIEAQQKRIDLAEDRLAPVFLSIDVGPVRYKRILERMIDDENPPVAERSVASFDLTFAHTLKLQAGPSCAHRSRRHGGH